MVKVAKKTSKRIGTRQRAKVTKKVSRFKRDARRTARKLKKTGVVNKRKEKDPLLSIPNNWPGKEEILRAAIDERKSAIEAKKQRKELAKKRREWEKKNPEKARVKRARAEHRALQLEQAQKDAAKSNQIWSAQLTKVLPRVNCILHVIDCRAPLASLSQTMETLVKEHQVRASLDADAKNFKEILVVYILNKVDLVPKEHTEAWIRTLTAVLTDEPKLKIRRKLALYTARSTLSPGILMQQLQTVWLRSASKHKITAVVTGYGNVGKKTIIRDLEVTSNIVSVHASSACPVNPRSKIPAGKEFCIITLPTDSTVASTAASALNCIFKNADAPGLPADKIVSIADSMLASTGAVRLSAFYKVAKATSGAQLLELVAKKRGLYTADKQLDVAAAGTALVRDVINGKIPVAEQVPSEGSAIVQKARLGTEPVNVLADAFHADILKDCTVQKGKLITAAHDLFVTKDFPLVRAEVDKAAKAAVSRQEKDKTREEIAKMAARDERETAKVAAATAATKKDDDTYTFDHEKWAEDGEKAEASADEDAELSEDEVPVDDMMEELEEMEEDEEDEEDEEMDED